MFRYEAAVSLPCLLLHERRGGLAARYTGRIMRPSIAGVFFFGGRPLEKVEPQGLGCGSNGRYGTTETTKQHYQNLSSNQNWTFQLLVRGLPLAVPHVPYSSTHYLPIPARHCAPSYTRIQPFIPEAGRWPKSDDFPVLLRCCMKPGNAIQFALLVFEAKAIQISAPCYKVVRSLEAIRNLECLTCSVANPRTWVSSLNYSDVRWALGFYTTTQPPLKHRSQSWSSCPAMKRVSTLLSAIALLASPNGLSGVVAEPIPVALVARAAPSVDLGYAIYEGSYDPEYKVNSFKRYTSCLARAIEHP
jgi:hypothetical protein